MELKKILWLEDEYEDLDTYLFALYRAGYLVDTVKSVSEAVRELREENYTAVILDIKVLPGDEEEWKNLDKKKRNENPGYDSYLGLELLRSLFSSEKAQVRIKPPITINPRKIIVFSGVSYKDDKEIISLKIPKKQIVYKSDADLTTLPKIIKKIENET